MKTNISTIPQKILTGAAFILCLLLLSFVTAKADTIKIQVKEETAACTGVAPQTCMLVKYKSSKDWELFYSQIEGFKYQPGYRYQLSVSRTKRKNVPADASAYQYKLLQVLKKQKVQPAEKAKQADIWTFIAKHRWNLIQLNGKTVQKVQPFLQFDINKGRVNGNSGCNSIFGSFEKTSSTISFKQLASTMMACLDQEANNMEREFNQTITGKRFTFDVADQTLNLYQNGKIVLMFGMAR